MSFKNNKFPPKKANNSHIIKANVIKEWSPFQKDIFRDIARSEGHTIVDAYAGTAKTTTLIESFKYVPKGKKVLALAFNKIIQEELRSRSPSYVDCLTFHSLGLRAAKQKFGTIEINDTKTFGIVKDFLDKGTDNDLINNICDTIAYCKYGLLDTPTQIDSIISRFSIDLCGLDRDSFVTIVIQALGKCKADTKKIDFNDMCWMPFVYNLFVGQYDFVYVDEVQDLNKSQMVMARKACKPDGRIITFGDEYQSLYSWRMSDTSVLDDIKKQEKTKTLPLPISYRCPKNIINLAKNWVPKITCPDSAIHGQVNNISLNELYSDATPGCFILSRTNAPMIKICMQFIRNGVKANIRGRDVGKQLSYLIKKSKKKQIPAFIKWLDEWKDNEVKILESKNISTENILDRHECLVNLCEECKTLDEVVTKTNELFNDTDENNIIILSTVHRAKGLEKDDVFVLRWTFKAWLDQDCSLLDKPNEEMNIAYVAATRVKKRLFIVRKF